MGSRGHEDQGQPLRNVVRAVDTVLAANPGSEVAAVLWHRGESDVPLMSVQEYQVKLDSVIDDLRRRYGEDVPFLLGGMVPEEMGSAKRTTRPSTPFMPIPRIGSYALRS